MFKLFYNIILIFIMIYTNSINYKLCLSIKLCIQNHVLITLRFVKFYIAIYNYYKIMQYSLIMVMFKKVVVMMQYFYLFEKLLDHNI